jgi:hypothetical protein
MGTLTHYFQLYFQLRDFLEMVAITPPYDGGDCRELTLGWWKGKLLSIDGWQITTHLAGIFTEGALLDHFGNVEGLDLSDRAPTSGRPKWILIKVPARVMNASRKAHTLYKRRVGKENVPELTLFRMQVLRALVLKTYGGDPKTGWDK